MNSTDDNVWHFRLEKVDKVKLLNHDWWKVSEIKQTLVDKFYRKLNLKCEETNQWLYGYGYLYLHMHRDTS